jgi:hypothetical protein
MYVQKKKKGEKKKLREKKKKKKSPRNCFVNGEKKRKFAWRYIEQDECDLQIGVLNEIRCKN